MAAIIIDGQDLVDDNISTSGISSNDTVVSSTYGGNDTVTPWNAQYDIHFGDGNDRLNGGYSGSAWGEAGNDTLWAFPYQGTHNLYGGDDNDFIGETGSGSVAATVNGYGGDGHDTFHEVSQLALVANNWDGGSGFDVLMHNDFGPALQLTLGGSGGSAGFAPSTYTGVEGVGGTRNNDTMTGSRFDDLLVGNGGSDVLSGEGGDDFLIGEARSRDFFDAFRGIKSGFATVNALDPLNCNASGAYTFDDTGGLADSLYGGRGDDVLSGGYGADLLNGGRGADWATYHSAGESVVLNLGSGGTAGQAAGDVFDSIENAQGSEYNDTLTGNNGANELRGQGGQDSLDGRGGNDTLLGGEGRDTLIGGDGADVLTGGNWEDSFVFSGSGALLAVDMVTDMLVNHDDIWLSRKAFAGIGTAGLDLSAAAFSIGAVATERAHRIIYDDTTGALWFDADGNRSGLAVQFAQLQAGLALTAGDFLVIA